MNIRDIAPNLAPDFMDIDSDQTAVGAYKGFLETHAHQLGAYRNYLNGRLHDSWVRTLSITKRDFTIVLNDFATHVYADVIVARKLITIDHDRLVFPIVLTFEDVELTFNKVDEHGSIQRIQPSHFNEYLSEEIISVNDESITLAVVVWKDGKRRGNKRQRPGSRILLLITTKRIRVDEMQGLAWNRVFGPALAPYYDYFDAQRTSGRFGCDLQSGQAIADEFEQLSPTPLFHHRAAR